MSLLSQEVTVKDRSATKIVLRVLFLSSVISTVFGGLYLLGLTGKLLVDGSIHSASSPSVQVVSAAIGLLWDMLLVILFMAMRRLVTGAKAIYADLGLIFMILLGATSSINWYVQLTLVPKMTQAGETAILALIDIHQDNSIMYAIEHLAWGLFFGLATIFMAIAIKNGKLEGWIRWLLITCGALSIVHVFGIIASVQLLIDLGYFAAGVLLPAATLLLAIWCRKALTSTVDKDFS